MKKVRVRHVPRERDDEVLRWLHMRLGLGMSWAAIAKAEGLSCYQAVQSAVQPVIDEMRADRT